MKTNATIAKRFVKAAALAMVLAGLTIGAFATLGDGNASHTKPAKRSLLSTQTTRPGSFSLRSGYNFRGSQVINTQAPTYINLNTTATFHNGKTSYIIPLKKKVLVENVKIDLSNRQLRGR